jgi:sigma-E factor negative regulatory protein RseA
MTVENKEWLSALLDGEVSKTEMQSADLSEVDKEAWSRYQLIGEVMRNEETALNNKLCDSIEAALEQEATLVSLEARRSWKQRMTEKLRAVKGSPSAGRFGQVAIAASAALFALVGVQNMNNDAALDGSDPFPVLQTSGPLFGNAAPVSYSQDRETAAQNQQELRDEQRKQQMLMRQQRIHELIIDHQQQVRMSAANQSNSQNQR